MNHSPIDDLGDAGFGWLMDERYARTSHALAADGRVWLVDPVDVDGLDERVRTLGEPAAVLQLLDRHNRDCAAIASRLGVPHHVVPETLPQTPFELVRVVRLPRWHEVALWWPERRVLVCADAAGHGRLLHGRRRTGGRSSVPSPVETAARARFLRARAPARRPRRGPARRRGDGGAAACACDVPNRAAALVRRPLAPTLLVRVVSRRVRSSRGCGQTWPDEPRRRDEARVPHGRVDRLGERRGAEARPPALVGDLAVERRPLPRRATGRADQLLHPLRRAAPAPTPSRRRGRSTRSSACRRGR